MRLLALLVVLCHASLAAADTFSVLTTAKPRWTYDVVKGKKHKPTGVKATLAVTGVHVAGAYTVIELDTTMDPASNTEFHVQPGTWIIGPDGLREVLFFSADDGGYTEAHVASSYKAHYVPRAYLQLTPAVKHKLHWKLERFGDEDREYNVTGSIAKLDAHTWRTAWKGAFVVPENGEKDAYSWSTDYDPAVGFTQICTEADVCLRLQR